MSIKVCNIRLDKEHLEQDQNRLNIFLNSVNVKLATSNFVTTGTTDYWSVLIFYEHKPVKQIASTEQELTPAQEEKYLALKEWRNHKAAVLNISHYMISYNSELMALAVRQPKTLAELRNIKGFGVTKTAKFGKEIIAVLHSG